MLLRNSLYHIIAQNGSSYSIRFNAEHPVFAGHFPNYPIVPGACLVQIAEDLLSERQPVYPDKDIILGLKKGEPLNTFIFQFSISNSLNASFSASYMCLDTDV